MKITNSLIFVPENSTNVKKQMMMGNRQSFNPLLRNINVKNRLNTHAHSQQRRQAPINNSNNYEEREVQTTPKRIVGGGKTFIKNITGGPILINILNGHDDHGYPNYKEIKIPDYIRKDKLSLQDADSYEISVLYDAGKIIDISEDQYRQELEANKNKNVKKQTRMRQDFHDLESIENQNQERYEEANGKQIKITEDLYAGSRSPTEDFEVGENTRLSRETEVLMSGGASMSDDIDELIPGGRSYVSRRPPPQERAPRDRTSGYERPSIMADPEKAIRRR